MPRSPRADEVGGLYHALNRGNLRATIFHREEDYVAFEKILYEALDIHKVLNLKEHEMMNEKLRGRFICVVTSIIYLLLFALCVLRFLLNYGLGSGHCAGPELIRYHGSVLFKLRCHKSD